MARAFSPLSYFGAHFLGRCPRLIWGRAFGALLNRWTASSAKKQNDNLDAADFVSDAGASFALGHAGGLKPGPTCDLKPGHSSFLSKVQLANHLQFDKNSYGL